MHSTVSYADATSDPFPINSGVKPLFFLFLYSIFLNSTAPWESTVFVKGFPWVNKGIIIIIIMLLTHTGVYLDTGTTEQLWDGGGAPLATQYWGGHKALFRTNSL